MARGVGPPAGSRERAERTPGRRPLRATARAVPPVRTRGRVDAQPRVVGRGREADGGGLGPRPWTGRALRPAGAGTPLTAVCQRDSLRALQAL